MRASDSASTEYGRREYREVVAQFRRLTNRVRPETGRCCAEVVDGVPECCIGLVDDLEFTFREIAFLDLPIAAFVYDSGIWRLNAEWWTDEMVRRSAIDGHLANCVEAASHPTRPILIEDRVVGVVVTPNCNADFMLPFYRESRGQLMWLWQWTVDLTGTKPYYCTWRVADGWAVL